jgi:membrane associated rhomboid family serine protease
MLPKDRQNLQLVNLVIVDVAVVLSMTLLISRGIVPLYPGAAIAYPLLFAINVLWIWARNRRGMKTSIPRRSIPLLLWIVVAIFTFAGLAAVMAYLRSPSMPLGVQAAVAVLLVGYLWFLIYRLDRSRHNQVPK